MVLKNLTLKNFRIHKDALINFSDNINYIIGGNGQGKTSILEAIHYLCATKSFSSRSDSEAVNFGRDHFEISGRFSGSVENDARVYFSASENKKRYFLDHKQSAGAAAVFGKFPIVVLTPDDHSLTQGAPADRRKFADSVISQASETYLRLLIDYNKTLRQRAALLYQIKERPSSDLLEQLDSWTNRLVSLGSEIIKRRIDFVSEFNSYVKSSYAFIMGDKEKPEIDYSYLDKPGREDIENRFFEIVSGRRREEIIRASNLVGPHRDEFIFLLNNIELKKYGSQGQNKTFQIALRFAQFFYLKDVTGKTPIFLMDDVFGELDSYRAGKISEYLKDVGQTFITLTDFSNYSNLIKSESDRLIKISGGVIHA
jgi:DNA replication and repair protein RecF